jgi:hypothetical protein
MRMVNRCRVALYSGAAVAAASAATLAAVGAAHSIPLAMLASVALTGAFMRRAMAGGGE